ncbi:MAG: CocE/NonD family hydrolase, partial [Actinobacteria bacterium]|nr:CocE/NonD family hydrolase [Actinomycetota bacterium]
MHRLALSWVLLVALLASTGVAEARPRTPAATRRVLAQGTRCAHPHPCDYRWRGPAGPYKVRPVEQVSVKSHDGVKLNGFILRPDVPKNVKVPVIFASTPYMLSGTEPASFWVGGILGKEFVSAGYAVAYFSARGTGDSGGCFGLKSKAEQKDLPVVIDWLADRPWSNGRVAMQGLSYPGTTPVMAANQNPPALKTIVIAGTILDEYGFIHTPQGAAFLPAVMTVFGAAPAITAQYSLIPGSPNSIDTMPERLCEEVVEANIVFPRGEVTGDRDAEFWTERRFIDHVPGITAATLVVHGFQDRYGSGHAFQDDWAWENLDSAPKRMLVGQWWHEWPHVGQVFPDLAMKEKDWHRKLLAWFDYWLKGKGDRAPGLGDVDFQDSSGAWSRTDAWPPPEAENEVLYLHQQKIQPRAGDESASFLSVPPPWTGGTDPDLTGMGGSAGNDWRWTAPCPD